jgi:hypothetical protein
MSAIEEQSARLKVIAGGRVDRPSTDERGRLALPPMPSVDDPASACAWLTAVFMLDPKHPVVRGEWQGQRGPDGHIALHRAGVPGLRFEPARSINTPQKLIESFTGRRQRSDAMLPAFRAAHCRQIAYVIESLCDLSAAETEETETLGIIGTFLQMALPAEGFTTWGTPGQRYEAARALRRDLDEVSGRQVGPPRYIVEDSGEIVIAVSELAEAARRHVGSSLPRGWLDARMDGFGWDRITIDGHAAPGRAGRQGAHATVRAYRGVLRHISEREAVTT